MRDTFKLRKLGALLVAFFDWVDWCFMPRDFVCVTIDGVGCTMTPADACDCVASLDDDTEYHAFPVRMTAASFEALDEFYGW